jgi:hypothetical protein
MMHRFQSLRPTPADRRVRHLPPRIGRRLGRWRRVPADDASAYFGLSLAHLDSGGVDPARQSQGDVWFATHAQVVEWARDHAADTTRNVLRDRAIDRNENEASEWRLRLRHDGRIERRPRARADLARVAALVALLAPALRCSGSGWSGRS